MPAARADYPAARVANVRFTAGASWYVAPVFGGRSYRGGRVRVYGCSPGCLLASLALSVLLTIIVNVLIRAAT